MLNAVLRSHWSIFGKNESCGQSCGSFTEVDKEYIVSPVRGLNLIIYVYTSELGNPHTVCDHLKLTVLTKYFAIYLAF